MWMEILHHPSETQRNASKPNIHVANAMVSFPWLHLVREADFTTTERNRSRPVATRSKTEQKKKKKRKKNSQVPAQAPEAKPTARRRKPRDGTACRGHSDSFLANKIETSALWHFGLFVSGGNGGSWGGGMFREQGPFSRVTMFETPPNQTGG